MPAYVNDGKTVVAVGEHTLWTYDLRTKTATSHSTSLRWEIRQVRKIGDDVFVEGADEEGDGVCKRFDAVKNEYVTVASEALGRSLDEVIPATFEGKKCLLVWVRDSQDPDDYDVYSYPALEKVNTVKLKDPISAGNFWWLQVTSMETGNDPSKEVDHIEVFSPQGKKTCTISKDELDKSGTSYRPIYARVSSNGGCIAIVGGPNVRDNSYGFAVFDTTNGKFLFGYSESEPRVIGTPLVTATEAWTFNAVDPRPKTLSTRPTSVSGPTSASKPTSRQAWKPTGHIELVRYTPGRPGELADREVVLAYPLAPYYAGQFAPSPDGSQMVMVTREKIPRLLFFPLKAGVTEKDVTVVELGAKESRPTSAPNW